jgi:endonuclease/exonuclease/phosphatase family metal-dependent hydrolase
MSIATIRRIALVLLTIYTGWGLTACSDNSDSPPAPPAPPVKNLTMTTYNMGLALNFVPYTNERLVANESLLGDYDSDVICFQEVWLENQVDAVVQSVEDRLPHIYTVPPEQVFTEEAACTSEEISGLEDCTRDLCPGLSGADLVSCVPAQCGVFLGQLSPDCLDGVISSVGVPDITVDQLVEIVTQPAGKFAYDGSLGLILASRYPLENREFQDFIDDSTANHRGALYADVEVGEESLLVGCTHVTSDLSATADYPSSGKYGSWAGENLFMQGELVSFAHRKAQGRPILFGGDFNCGFDNAANGVDAELPDNCQLWLDDGFASPAAEQLPCTFCNDENLVLQLGDGSGNQLIDHVYVKNLSPNATLQADRVFDDPVSIEATNPPSELQPEDSPIMMHPSDHFGVELSISWQ